MTNFIKRLSLSVEFIIVMLLAFGWFSYSSIDYFLYYFTVDEPIDVISSDDSGLYSIIKYELIAGAIIAWFLCVRGMRADEFKIRITLFLTFSGALLMVVDYSLYIVIYNLLFEPIFGDYRTIYPEDAGEFYQNGLLAVILLSIINPVFEEVLVVAYVHKTLIKRFSFIMVMNVSVLIRLTYHLYQGPIGFISIIPMGILYFYIYAKYQRIWPLIFSHALLDFMALY